MEMGVWRWGYGGMEVGGRGTEVWRKEVGVWKVITLLFGK